MDDRVACRPELLAPRRASQAAEGASTARDLSRRDLLRGAVAAGGVVMAGAASPRAVHSAPAAEPAKAPAVHPSDGPRVAVIGAGAFGGWTALWLLRRGARVTLVDAWGAGNSRASSGGETRVIRGMYGPDRVYTEWVARAFELWRDAERRWQGDFCQPLYQKTGALWMFRGDDGYARASMPFMEEVGLSVRRLDGPEARRRFPGIDFDGVAHVYYEEEAGYLTARRACQAVERAVAAEGGDVVRASAAPGAVADGRMASVRLDGGATLSADHFVFACGPWLGTLFPELVGERLRPSRQDVFYFGTPAGRGAGASSYDEESLPVWVDFGKRVLYGIPGNRNRGFKIADDTHGERIDPTDLERVPRQDSLERVRALLRERFPGMAGAPLVETRVCQYTNTPDGHYLIDRHPQAANTWIVGGGSGHGFKLCPVLGEHVADWVLGRAEPLEKFSFGRLETLDGSERSQLSGKEQGP